MSTLLRLDAATDPGVCGHKAATMAALKKLGFDVPDGFVIPAGCIPDVGDVAAALAALGAGPVAVRSSGVAEDLPDASFAGQYDTVLNVEGADAVLRAARACVASVNGARVEAYGRDVRPMAVLVQRMVHAEVAGVAFSANPLTGNRTEATVSAVRGLGDQLVDGSSDADEWVVNGHKAVAVAQPHAVLDADLATRVADLARRAEATRGAPQDIEWAVEQGRLWLLQSRPITALPVAPAIEAPKGTWQKDAGHFPEPMSPFSASTQLRYANQFIDEGVATWGLLPDRLEFKMIGHEPYAHIVPDDGGKNPPPWWVLAVVARLVPSLRRKLQTSARAVNAGLLESMPRDWATTQQPGLLKELETYAALDLSTLDDSALFEHLDELERFYLRCLQLHFSLAIPNAVGLYELFLACRDLLGWDLQKTVGLLQGLSTGSTVPADALAGIARRGAARATTREVLLARRPDVLARLDEVDPSVAAELRQYLQFWGLRPLGPEPGCPSVAERPQLVADLLADALDSSESHDFAAARRAIADQARARLTGDARRRFDDALAYAERVYPLREDNVVLTDHLPVGLLRRVALEAGRRLVALGLLRQREDAVMLTSDELRHALRTREAVATVVSRRKAEHAWVRANPGPITYGPEPGKEPDLRGLPEPARRVNAALLWMLAHELTGPPKPNGQDIAGIGVSAGVYRGRVRVITTADQLETLRHGEVLVCPTTSAAWMMVFRRAGAMVTDTGSVLSHTAIVAREFSLPAVVATGDATARLVDGEEVIVDGGRGVVTRVVMRP
jgi:pyruvate,water dikinase